MKHVKVIPKKNPDVRVRQWLWNGSAFSRLGLLATERLSGYIRERQVLEVGENVVLIEAGDPYWLE